MSFNVWISEGAQYFPSSILKFVTFCFLFLIYTWEGGGFRLEGALACEVTVVLE